jgi:hypothetical protein
MSASDTRGAVSVTQSRFSASGRVWAVVFVILIVLPFTAPFQTIDLSGHAQQPQRTAVVTEKTPTKDIAVAHGVVRPVLTIVSVMREVADALSRPTHRPPLTTALRL